MARQQIDFNDPITLQVLWNRLIFIADQADRALGRTAFSPVVRENHDYVTVLMDAKGRALAQCTWAIPVFITSLPMAAQHYFLPAFPPETLEPGDVLLTNDPLIGTGHLPDMVMITPIFHKGKLIGYSGSIAHMPDIGGRPYSPDSTDIFEEGVRLPILKLYKAGKPTQEVFDILGASVRLPREVLGDIESMVSANDVMARELVRFLEEYGLDDVEALGNAIHGRSEAHMRQAISRWPTGEYSSEVTLDGYDSEVTLKCIVKVEPGAIHVDYAGTSEQVLHAINVRKHYRYAHTVYALKCLLDPETPNNEGCMLPITDEAPAGSILNPRNTAAGNLRNLVGHVIPSLIFRALEGVVPDKVQGDSGGAPIWGAGRTLHGRRRRHAELSLQLPHHADRDVRTLRPGAARMQRADSRFRRRWAISGRAWSAPGLPQHLTKADEHLSRQRACEEPLLRRRRRQGWPGGPCAQERRACLRQGPHPARARRKADRGAAGRRRLGRPGQPLARADRRRSSPRPGDRRTGDSRLRLRRRMTLPSVTRRPPWQD
jgi:hypothetical protein